MIRVKCPKCSQSLSIDDSKGGAVGKCPACGQKFRIPEAKTSPAAPPPPAKSAPEKPRTPGDDPTVAAPRSPSPKQPGPKEPAAEKADFELVEDEPGLMPLDGDPKPAPPPAKKSPPAKKEPQLEIEEDEPEFEIVEEGPRFKKPGVPREKRPVVEAEEEIEEAEPMPRRRQPRDEDDDAVIAEDEVQRRPPRKRPPEREEEEDFEDEDRPRRRKRGRRSRERGGEPGQLIPGLDNYQAILIAVGLLWVVLFVAGLIAPPMAWILYGCGSLIWMAGYVWFLVVAFQDEVFHGVLCLCCGPYFLYYLGTHFDTTWRPFVIYLIGAVMHASAIPLGAHWLLTPR